ncbi:MAG: DUF1800 domain-containing protein [Fimbriimonadaceae bacterium]
MKLQTERDRVAHLLRRFGLGSSETELEYYGHDGLKGAIDRLLGYQDVPVIGDWDSAAFANKQGVVNIRVAQGLWYGRVLATSRPLEERLTIFWHNHFATSAEKVDSAYAMLRHVDLLRRNCLGKFGTLLSAVSTDPAMIFWLDNNENVVGKPNENFAREVMELFTLGIGHYTEKDIQEAARAFTGWTFGVGQRFVRKAGTAPRRADRFIFDRKSHDGGEKTVFGKTGNFGGEDILESLIKNPQTSLYITQKFLTWFAYPNPETRWVERLAKKFSDSDLDIGTLVRAIMESEEFYSERAANSLIKNPVDFCVATARQLGIGARISASVDDAIANPIVNAENGLNQKALRAIAPAFAVRQSMDSMGMDLMYPPDVSGWKPGSNWITTSTVVERIKWGDRLFLPSAAAIRANVGAQGNRNPSVGYDASEILGGLSDPKDVVAKLVSVFDARISENTNKTLVQSASDEMRGTMTRIQANAVAKGVSKLLFASPEFQFN